MDAPEFRELEETLPEEPPKTDPRQALKARPAPAAGWESAIGEARQRASARVGRGREWRPKSPKTLNLNPDQSLG